MSAVQDPAPVNVEVNENEPPTEQMPENNSSQEVAQNIPKGVSILMLIYTWQSAGIRIVIDLPSQTNNVDPLFYIRSNPLCIGPAFVDWWFARSESGGIGYMSNQLMAVFTTSAPNNGVTITYWGAPPFISILAAMYRKWRGALEYKLRATASFANQGFITMSPAYGVYQGRNLASTQRTDNTNRPITLKGVESYRQTMFNSFVNSDAAGVRHMACKVPFRYPTPWYDTFQWINDLIPGGMGTDTPAIPSSPPVIDRFPQSVVSVNNMNTINATNATGSNQIIYELFIRASEDFEFADRHLVLPFWNVPCETADSSNVVVIPNALANTDASDPGRWNPHLTGLPS